MGAASIGHTLDTPPLLPFWQDHLAERMRLLDALGFRVRRETRRFDWRAETGGVPEQRRLTYRDLDEVGEDALIAALVEVSAGSLDQRTQDERERLGTEREARETFADLRQLGYEPAGWRLAYTSAGELVGLVMPSRNPTISTIGFIGVVPRQRGHGYINDLLVQATARLHAAAALR